MCSECEGSNSRHHNSSTSAISSITAGDAVRLANAMAAASSQPLSGEHDLHDVAAKAAQEAGVTANHPLQLLDYARSAIIRDTGDSFKSDLGYALREIKGVVTISHPSPTAANLQLLTFLETRALLWGSFEVACTYLARDDALKEHPVIALDAICILHETMCHFEIPSSISYYRGRSRDFTKYSEPVWRALWTNRALLLSPDTIHDTIRWFVGAHVLHLWAILCRSFECLPAWGTTEPDIFRLLVFLFVNQPNTESEDAAPLLVPILMLDCIGSKSSIELSGQDRTARLTAIVNQISDIYGIDVLLRRLTEALSHPTASLGRQHQIRTFVYQYGVQVPSVCCRLWDAGTMEAYLQSNRRKRQSSPGDWGSYDAALIFELVLKTIKVSGDSRPKIISLVITKEHLARDFLLPALSTLLESLCIPHGDGSNPPGNAEMGMIRLLTDVVTESRSARDKTGSQAVMDTLRAEVSPYWHLMNDTMQGARPPQFTAFTQKGYLQKAWKQLGKALELNLKRAPRQIEDVNPDGSSFCSWPICVYHSQEPPGALKQCKGCAEVQYCGRQCQISDWKLNGHKTRCRRLKD